MLDDGHDPAASAEYLGDYARIAYEQGDLVRAEQLLVEASSRPDASPGLWENLGLVRMDRQDFHGAIAAYDHAVDTYPESRINRGLAYERIDDAASARADYEAALPHLPDDVDLLVNLGTLDLSEDRIHDARAHLEHAASLDPTANWQLGDVFVALGRLDAARRAYQRAVRAGEPRALLDLAELADEGGYPEAEALYRQAVAAGVDGADRQLADHLRDVRGLEQADG